MLSLLCSSRDISLSSKKHWITIAMKSAWIWQELNEIEESAAIWKILHSSRWIVGGLLDRIIRINCHQSQTQTQLRTEEYEFFFSSQIWTISHLKIYLTISQTHVNTNEFTEKHPILFSLRRAWRNCNFSALSRNRVNNLLETSNYRSKQQTLQHKRWP